MELKFNLYNAYINNDGRVEPIVKHFDNFISKWRGEHISFTLGKDDNLGYSITDMKINGQYVLLKIKYGKIYPKPAEYYNIDTHESRDNIRKNNEIEGELTFIMMDFYRNIVLLPNNKLLKNTYQIMMNKLLNDGKLKLLLKSRIDNEFFQKVRKIKSFAFKVSKPNIFHEQDSRDLMDILVEDFNDYNVDDLSIKLGYKNNQGSVNKIKGLYNKLTNTSSPLQSDCITIVGYDEKDFEMIFNKNEYNKRISIEVEVDENKNICDNHIEEKIINRLEEIDE